MAKLRFSAVTSLPPERIMEITTDFSAERLKWWPGIDPKVYKVLHSGVGWAEVTEGNGTPLGAVWARERYEWSDNKVFAQLQESNIFKSGTWQLTATANEGGGSRVEILYHRQAKGIRGHIIGAMLQISKGKPLAEGLKKTLSIAEQEF